MALGATYAGSADIGYNSEFLIGQGDSPETFVALKDVIEVDMGGFDADIYEKTHLKSPGRAKEKGAGLSDYDDITVRCNYNRDPASGHVAEGGGSFSATHNMAALNKSLIECNFLALIGSTSPQREIPITGIVKSAKGPVVGPSQKMEITYTITPLRDYRP